MLATGQDAAVSDPAFDALLLVSFGGPEGPDDVLPFMERVTAGRGIPRERLVEVSAHYQLFGGVSPINGQCRELLAAIRDDFAANGIDLPVYWGNRNWHPFLADTVRTMRDDGVRNALAFVTSAYSSYSGCRQYLDDLERARAEVGDGAPTIAKLRQMYDHPGFVEPLVAATLAALERLPSEMRTEAPLAMCAHSIPTSMADTSQYVSQLTEAARLVALGVAEHDGIHRPWRLVFQSRSGAPGQPWLEPDISDHLRSLASDGTRAAVMVPIGFVSDHMEVVYDLDTQAMQTAAEIEMTVTRAATPGVHPAFVQMVSELVLERTANGPRRSLGRLGLRPDRCPEGCCPAPIRPGR